MKDHTRPRTARANARDTSTLKIRRVAARAGIYVSESSEQTWAALVRGGGACSF
jgi:hypothetical protein